jgi:hypothetical protein
MPVTQAKFGLPALNDPKRAPVKLEDIDDNLEALGRGDVVGRAVIVFD